MKIHVILYLLKISNAKKNFHLAFKLNLFLQLERKNMKFTIYKKKTF